MAVNVLIKNIHYPQLFALITAHHSIHNSRPAARSVLLFCLIARPNPQRVTDVCQ